MLPSSLLANTTSQINSGKSRVHNPKVIFSPSAMSSVFVEDYTIGESNNNHSFANYLHIHS